MIIVCITGPTMADAILQMKRSRRFADMFEARLDLIDHPDIIGLLNAAGRPVLVTCRTVSQGGKFRGADADRITMLKLASAFGADYVDLEHTHDSGVAAEWTEQGNEARVVLSHHAQKPPAKVDPLLKQMCSMRPAVVKLVYPCTDSFEISLSIDFLAAAAKLKQPAVAFATGEAGEASRILYRKFGAWATFAAPEEGPPAAEGQVQASVLRRVYRADLLEPGSRVFGVIGTPLAQSRGAQLHNPLFRRAGLNAVYCRFPVRNLDRFISGLAPMMDGFSVTVPHKQAIVAFLDEIDPAASKIGAVNTVLRRSGRFWGTNTDGTGALDAIEQTGPVRGTRVLVLGAGGAARAVIAEAQARGAEVLIANRTPARARKVAKEFGIEAIGIRALRETEYDTLINATTVGMIPQQAVSPVPKSILAGKRVFDVVFNPPVTRLMKEAAEAGGTVIAGTEMYLRQAAAQSLLYTGRKASLPAMRKILGYGA